MQINILQSKVSDYYGASLIVHCYATGTPQPTVNWYKDGNLLSSYSEVVSVDQCHTNITKTLTIPFLMKDHEGIYTCTGTNILPNGTATQSKTFTLSVNGSKLCILFDIPLLHAMLNTDIHYLSQN